jgi:transketolase
MNERQRRLRLSALKQIRRSGSGHSGRILSAIDLMEGLYFGKEHERSIFRHNPEVPQDPARDFFVLSKLEALPGFYSVLEEAGYRLPAILPSTPSRKVPGVEVTTNEHAYALSYAVGLAQGIKMDRLNQHVFCLMGDYELKHGQAWESIRLAAEHRLDRLCLVVDENDPRDQMIQERFEAFGWKVIKLFDAHDHDDIAYAYMKARLTQRKPTCIWAPTIKSAGVPFAERKPEYDDVVYSDAELDEIIKILT